MPGVVDTPAGPSWPGLGYTVAHQKVELELDFASRSLKGKTEIIIHPDNKDLRTIRLNFRQGELKRVSVSGKVPTVKYADPYESLQLYGPHYHQRLASKIDGLLKTPSEPDLLVTVPKSVRIDELDPTSDEAQDQMALRAPGFADDTEGPLSSKAAETSAPRFTALTVNIEFIVENIRDGLQFVGLESGDKRYPHAYTTNSLDHGTGCPLFPCVDDPSSRCTWEVSIRCPCTLGDIFDRKSRDQSGGGTDAHPKTRTNHDRFAPDDEALDLSVVCSGDLTDDIVDPKDPSKKTVSFASYSPLSARQIGFAVGPFEYVNLADFRESDQDEQLGQNAIPLHAFCLPGRGDEVRNTCFPMAKAIDYFSMTYGSYPFASYKICFVDDAPEDTLPTACFSICSSRLLFPEEIIDPMYDSTRAITHALAVQWIGVNIVPMAPVDTWVTVGVSWYITDTFMRKLCGNNEYRFRLKQMSDRVCDLDYERPSVYDMGNILSIDPSEAHFIALKAPLVLFILDRRLTKASGKATMSRIISRLFLNARMGLQNRAVTSSLFQKLCERLGHAKLETFFQQWIYGAGCPRFQATQRFNKKKLVVEMMIKQVQSDQPSARDLEKDAFMRDVKEEIRNVYAGTIQPVFSGSMTIRIHEADGTPYEHIVEIKEGVTKFDIPYNTKYKRLKRNKRQKERAAAVIGTDGNAEVQEDILLYCLGDVLQSEEEMQQWRLADWSKEDEERMGQESYEWIRMDADFEWICKLSLVMPGYMYLSQLQQDRDVVAQLESLQYMAAQREHALISTIFLRTLMDRRYFYGIRVAAARALVKHAKEEINWLGLFHLEKAFQELFCLPNSPMTRSNDFTDRAAYVLQLVIPDAISRVRDVSGKTPMRVKRFLYDKLKFNDNSNNEYSDNFYVATLMKSLCHAMLGRVETHTDDLSNFDMDAVLEAQAEEQLEKDAMAEIDRYRRMDEWSSSYQNLYSRAALHCQMQLMQAKITGVDIMQFLPYTRVGTYDLLRLDAFQCLVELDIFKSPELLRWFIFTMSNDPSVWLRWQLHGLFGKALAPVAFGRGVVNEQTPAADGLIIEQESSTEIRQADLARRQTVTGALAALKTEVSGDLVLKECLWAACCSPIIGVLELSEFADLCRVIYDPITTKRITLKYPRYWGLRHQGRGRLHFYRTNKIRTSLNPSTTSSQKRKREDGGAMPAPASGLRVTFKQPKPNPHYLNHIPSTPSANTPTPRSGTPLQQRQPTKLSIPNFAAAQVHRTPSSQTPATPSTPGGGLKLKLKLGSQPKQ
ncbi:transcription initiation factor TFIID subunit TAF2 [Aspergillus mulundensis]|uniref:Transcription initiation factor TFIID subunit 2 n=1 Tax=Aspergillus mulundensis TaxID=1810919 RepID=A0A3D8S624_9EURO|nr:hypothetical protein DSM5745_05263 [Aspergillus mulundensis]RDW81706.1 hypothetical protein DSM5745_05263 [Aspergillus mulundensis]